MKKYIKIPLCLASITVLVSCNLEATPDNTALMTAINYEGDTRIIYSLDDEYMTPGYDDGDTHIASRKVSKGDYKPVWSTIQNRLGISMLEHQAAANSGDKKSVGYFRDNWMTKRYADISMGTVYDINNYSVAGNSETILDLKPYIEETQFIKVEDPDDPTKEIDIVDPEHPGSLPNIALFLHQNPGVKMSIITAKHSQPDKGGIYYIPYFDGFNEIEKATIMRADYVRRLLDDEPDDTFSTNNQILGKDGAKYTQHYEPRYYEEGNGDKMAPAYDYFVPPSNNNESEPVKYTKKRTRNIIDRQNELIKKGDATSFNLAKQFREYIDDRYGSHPSGDNPLTYYSDLFIGDRACYDSDELVALMRLVKVSSETLFGKGTNKEMVTMMPRNCDNQRSSDMYRWAGQVFGVKGPESRNMYLYVNGIKDYGEEYGQYGAIHDARGSEQMLDLLRVMRSLYQEGLILQDFDSKTATGTSEGKFADESLFSGGSANYAGFMLYDYPKDLNDWNKYNSAERKEGEEGKCNWVTPAWKKHGEDGAYDYNLRAVIGSIAKWDVHPELEESDPSRYVYMPFTESWASLKTSALCLNADLALPKNKQKLDAAFKLINFAYGDEGTFLLNYGPWEDGYITKKAALDINAADAVFNKDYVMYQGRRYPKLTPNAIEEYKKKSGYQRRFIGATLPFGFIKLSVVPYQTMEENTTKGLDDINKAIEYETFKHVLIGAYSTKQEEEYKIPFYQISPSAFFLSKGQSSAISSLLDKNKLGSMFTDSGSSNFNIWDALIRGEETRLGVTLDNYLEKMKEWQIDKLESYYQDAFEIMAGRLDRNESTK